MIIPQHPLVPGSFTQTRLNASPKYSSVYSGFLNEDKLTFEGRRSKGIFDTILVDTTRYSGCASCTTKICGKAGNKKEKWGGVTRAGVP